MDISGDIASGAVAGTHVKALGYLGFEVSNLSDWKRFAEEVLGLQIVQGPKADALYLKMDERPWRFIFVEGPADDIAFAGWEIADDAALDVYAASLAATGVATSWGAQADLALRNVDRLLRFSDPNGLTHEAYVNKAADGEALVPTVSRGGFVTGPGGLGHIVFGAKDYAASVAFARDVLGVGLTDTIEQVITDTITVHVTFMHVNERHHSIAFANRSGAKKLHHFMVQVERVDDVGLARDRHLKFGLTVAQDIGQHPNDHVISYYGTTPSGFLVEYGWGGVKVDVPNWTAGTYDRLSDWGHRPFGAGATPPPSVKPTAQEAPVSAPGTWNLVITTPMGGQPALLEVKNDLSGTITAMDETVNIYEGAFENNTLGFKADVTRPFAMTLAFSLLLTATSATGQALAGALGASPVTGERA